MYPPLSVVSLVLFPMFSLAELHSVLPIVRAAVPATPQYAWPLLRARTGVDVVVKHENHTPIGAFKVRGGLVYFHRLRKTCRSRSWCRMEIRPRRTPRCAR